MTRALLPLILTVAFAGGCHLPEEPKHAWTYAGDTVSMDVQKSTFSGLATIKTTKGQITSEVDVPQPFLVGVPVKVRDDGYYAVIGSETCQLREASF